MHSGCALEPELGENFAEKSVMRINSSGETPGASAAGDLASRNVAKAGSSSEAPQLVQSNAAEYSSNQSQVQALIAQVNQLPEVRQQKVEALAQAVRQGKYDVQPQQ